MEKQTKEETEKKCTRCGKIIVGEPFKEFKTIGEVYCCDFCAIDEEEDEE